MTDSREHHGDREGQNGLDAATAERLLSGADVEESDGVIADLATLLAVAAEPRTGRPEDAHAALTLFREQRFREQRDDRYGRGGRRTTRRARPAVVVTGAAVAVFALGGVVLAAQTGNLPGPFGPGSSTPGRAPSGSATGTPGEAPQTRGTPQSTPSASAPSAGGSTGMGTAHPSAPPQQSPSHPASAGGASTDADLKGLCEAYVRSARQGKALDAPSMARLATAAGGSDRIDAYCARSTGTAVGHTDPSATRHDPAQPSTEPSGTPR